MKTLLDRHHFRFIPAELGIPREVKAHVHARAWYRWRQNDANFAIYTVWVVCLAAGVLAAPLLGDAAPFGISLSGPLKSLIFYGYLLVVGVGGFTLMQRFRFAPCVWAELHARGYPICSCGYAREGIAPDAACPECGRSRGCSVTE